MIPDYPWRYEGMIKVHSDDNYDFYLGTFQNECNCTQRIYNIVPKGSANPDSGYENMRYIESVKRVQFPDRYQPTKNGMTHLFPNGFNSCDQNKGRGD